MESLRAFQYAQVCIFTGGERKRHFRSFSLYKENSFFSCEILDLRLNKWYNIFGKILFCLGMNYAKEEEKAKMGSLPSPYYLVVGVPGVMALHAY